MQRELVAAEAVQLFRCPQRALGDACERAQDVVADCMPETVVRVLEIVEIEQRKTEGRSTGEEQVELFFERAPVRQAGERIAPRLRAGEQKQALARDRRGCEIGDRGDELHVEHERELHRHCDEKRAERQPVRHERQRERVPERCALTTSSASVPESALTGARSSNARTAASGHANELVHIERTGGAGEPERSVAREVHRGDGSAGEVMQLSRDDRAHASCRRSRERVREPEQRIARSGDCALELPERRAFHAVRVGPGCDHRVDGLPVGRSGERNDPHSGKQPLDAGDRSLAVGKRQLGVQQHDIRRERSGERNRLLGVGRFADDLDLVLRRRASRATRRAHRWTRRRSGDGSRRNRLGRGEAASTSASEPSPFAIARTRPPPVRAAGRRSTSSADQDDPSGREHAAKTAGGLDAVEQRHLDVHEHDVGLQQERALDGLAPVVAQPTTSTLPSWARIAVAASV